MNNEPIIRWLMTLVGISKNKLLGMLLVLFLRAVVELGLMYYS